MSVSELPSRDSESTRNGPTLRSEAFRLERVASWRELETLLDGLELGRSPRRLSPEALQRLPVLYRNALSSLSVARAISLDANLLAYLETLAARAHLALHARRPRQHRPIIAFFAAAFPQAVRGLGGFVWLSIVLLLAGVFAGRALTNNDPEYFFAFVNEALAQERTPWADAEVLRATLYDTAAGMSLEAFAVQLFTHNAGIGLLAVMLGVLGGVFVLLLLFVNGAMLGAMWAVFEAADLGFEFAAWVLPHGVTELLAIALSGAAGLALGRAVLFPGALTRIDALSVAGRQAGLVALGATALFVVAALVEGLFRQQVQSIPVRFAVAFGSAALLFVWLRFAGRRVAAGSQPASGGR